MDLRSLLSVRAERRRSQLLGYSSPKLAVDSGLHLADVFVLWLLPTAGDHRAMDNRNRVGLRTPLVR